MPFRSEKQRRYLWKHEPKIAREWTDEYGSKPQPKKKKKGGRVKKNGPVRPIHIPWDSQKKKKGGIMEPYRGSYISGKVDGKMLSNPSLRKYYKGLI